MNDALHERRDRLKLSWVVTTYNRRPFLERTISSLLAEGRREDEEIIVADGGSGDGTVDYLKSLLDQGGIDQLISGSDLGEAHGLNRAHLAANAEVIKLFTDDDVFHWQSIRDCAELMADHRELDLVGTAGAGMSSGAGEGHFEPAEYEADYMRWSRTRQPFSFCGLGLMLRRSALAATGLFNSGVVSVDHEFTLRTTRAGVNMGWYTGRTWVHIGHDESNSATAGTRIAMERGAISALYEPSAGTGLPPARRRRLIARARRAASRLRPASAVREATPSRGYDEWAKLAEDAREWLAKTNSMEIAELLLPFSHEEEH